MSWRACSARGRRGRAARLGRAFTASGRRTPDGHGAHRVALGRRVHGGRWRQTDADHQNIVIASGARPFVPPIPGLDAVDYLASDTVWNLRELPRGWSCWAAGRSAAS